MGILGARNESLPKRCTKGTTDGRLHVVFCCLTDELDTDERLAGGGPRCTSVCLACSSRVGCATGTRGWYKIINLNRTSITGRSCYWFLLLKVKPFILPSMQSVCVCAGVLDAVLAVLMPFCDGERVTGSRRLVLKEASGKAVGDTRAGCLHVLPQM